MSEELVEVDERPTIYLHFKNIVALLFSKEETVMIQQFKDRYTADVRDLLKDNPYPLEWGEEADATLLMIDEEEIVGIGSLWTNSLHPYREKIGLYIQPGKRREGRGTKLYRELVSLSKTKKLQTAVSSLDQTAVEFVRSCGFNLARKCYTPVLKKERTAVAVRKEEIGQIVPLVNASEAQIEELVLMQMNNYKEFHQVINPLSETISVEEWKRILFGYLDETHSFLLVNKGEVEAYVLSYEGEKKDVLEIGYIGGKDKEKLSEYLPFYTDVIGQMTEQFKIVSIEADDVDPFAFAALNSFDYDERDSWDTYIAGDL